MSRKMFFLLFAALIAVGYYTYTGQQDIEKTLNKKVSVLLVYSSGQRESLGIRAFKSVLEEEGVSYQLISNKELLSIQPLQVLQSKPVIIYPDNAAGYVCSDTEKWLQRYLSHGGYVQITGDAGSRNRQGQILPEGSKLDSLAGIKRTDDKKANVFLSGEIRFSDKKSADYFGIPPGKYDKAYYLVGYQYGRLHYPYRNIRIVDKKDAEVYAWGNGKELPLLLLRKVGKGELLYVNLPLAELKGNSDDLLLRSVLRTFLFKRVNIPHLVAAPNAMGGLVINFHIDSNAEHRALPWFIDNGYITSALRYSFHITAGPDCYAPGDGMGFDAEGKGKGIVQRIMPFGTIGSHGGWAHNWFSENIKDGNFSDAEILKYIQKNNRALEGVTGYKIEEYSAPEGVFPQPDSVNILRELGMTSYYYPGDSGSAPNRTFYGGKMLSEKIIAFPVMTFGEKASLYEFKIAGFSGEKVASLLSELLDYTVRNRTVRLYYTHPYDIYLASESYKHAFKQFIDRCIRLQDEKQLYVGTMGYFRDFLLRLTGTKKVFLWEEGTMDITLYGQNGLREMVIAVPKHHADKVLKRSPKNTVGEDENYYYVQTDTNATEFHMDILYE